MLTIVIPGDESWDDESEKFRYDDGVVLEFEHSLVSVSKWEARYHKLFLTDDSKSNEEMVGYLECMLVTPGVSPETLERLTEDDIRRIDEYINNPMTGSVVSSIDQPGPKSSERISSELVYFWMSQFQIDMECEHWHLNRLFTLIKIHHAKTQKPKKMSRKSHAQQMAEVNAQRRAKMGTNG